MGIWHLVMETNRLSRPSGCPPGVSQPFQILGRSALIQLCRQNRVKNGKNRRVVRPCRRNNGTALVVLLPTVADYIHVVGPIMFGWGAKHLSRFSGVSHGFFTVFPPDFDDTTELKQNAPRSETAEERPGDTPMGSIACLFPSQDANEMPIVSSYTVARRR